MANDNLCRLMCMNYNNITLHKDITYKQNHIFDVRIDCCTKDDMNCVISQFIASQSYHHIVTLNPEILLHARRNDAYRDVLNKSDLVIADGIGIKFALWRFGHHLPQRMTGVNVMHNILDTINAHAGSVFLATNKNGLSLYDDVYKTLHMLYPRIDFFGMDIDPYNANQHMSLKITADVVLCNFGAPEQEYFLSTILSKHVKIGVGVGGSFDFVTGILPRAPHIMQKCGMEWLFRLYKQPHRWKRIIRAVIIFPVYIICNKK